MHRTGHGFWSDFRKLPEAEQRSARRNFDLLKRNARHPSLRFKKTGNYWSVRVGRTFRALAVQDGEDYVWVWIGGHDEYLRILGR